MKPTKVELSHKAFGSPVAIGMQVLQLRCSCNVQLGD